jgi:dTDP-4-dehydrorhamnose 3,5-epimerase
VIRGLHFQRNPDQGKLVGVIRGKIWDVAVDLRPSSPTYLQWVGTELDGDLANMLWIPPGFAHGFSVIGQGWTDVVYKVDGFFNPAGEGGIRFDDPDLKIDWKLPKGLKPILSKRDQGLGSIADYKKNPVFS